MRPGLRQILFKNTSGDQYKIVVNTANTGSATNTMILPFIGVTAAVVNWGDGTSTTVTTTSATKVYGLRGIYTITIKGTAQLYFNNIGDRRKVIAVHTLPSTLTNCTNMFTGCTNLTGNIPSLPPGLTNADSAFFSCALLTGSIPPLPLGLTSIASMFSGCTNISGSIPALPPGLLSATAAFLNCVNLTGSIPALPNSLTIAASTFRGCTNLTGTIPPLPTNLNLANFMFLSCTNLTGNVPVLPISVTNAATAFANCPNLVYTPGLLSTIRTGNLSSIFNVCAYPQAAVNAMMADLRSAVNSGFISPASLTFGVLAGTNAAPSGQGLIDKNYLISLGATISTN